MNVRKYARTCDTCAVDFVAAHPRARFCSENCRKRAHDDQHRGTCVDCGGALGKRSGYPNRSDSSPRIRCIECFRSVSHSQRLERASRIAEWWNAGERMAVICERLGWSKGSLGSEMNWMRANGFDLEPRRSDVGISNPGRGRRAVHA